MHWGRTSLAVLLSAASCTTTPARTLVPPAPASDATSRIVAATAPLAVPGEQMTYRISVHGIEVGEYVITVAGEAKLDGIDAIEVASSARTSRIAALLRPVHADFASWIDRATGRSLLFTAAEMASPDDPIREQTEARFHGDRAVVRVFRDDDAREEQQTLHGPGYDAISFLIFLRGWDPPPGTRVETDVMRSRYLWRIAVVAGGYGNLDTAMGQVAVARYDGESIRLRRDGELDPRSDRRAWSMWISDDADRVPLKIVARTDYGAVTMELTNYRPGAMAAR